jgi:receptor protein-tyrosine kinase
VSIIEKAVNRLGAQGIPEKQDYPSGPDKVANAVEEPLLPVNSTQIPPFIAEDQSSDLRLEMQGSTQYGEINLAKLKEAGMITPDGDRTQLSEEFRIIKRPLLTNAFNRGAAPIKNGNLVMVTSSFPGEGKSFSAINLAMSIAMERDHTVLLVDADMAKPSIPMSLGLHPGKGLMDLLLDEDLKFSDVLIKTNVDKLNVLPAGRSHPHATELLASEGMNRLLNEMAHRYSDRIIIFDSPPLLATTESRVLASRMGQIVMVVEAGKTPQAAVKEALSQIDKCEVVGLLLNKGSSAIGDDQFAYGSYGGYGGYGS